MRLPHALQSFLSSCTTSHQRVIRDSIYTIILEKDRLQGELVDERRHNAALLERLEYLETLYLDHDLYVYADCPANACAGPVDEDATEEKIRSLVFPEKENAKKENVQNDPD